VRRIPFGGLFLVACLGIGLTEAYQVNPLYPGAGFLVCAIAGLVWKQTILILTATLLFFGFWQSFRKITDQGYELQNLPELASRIHRVTLEAENDSKAFRWGNRIKQRFLAKVTAVDAYSTNFRVQAEVSGPAVKYGDRCQVVGRLAAPERALNPGEFDERSYLQHLGVYLVLSSAPGGDLAIAGHGWGNPILKIALNCRQSIERIPTLSLENDHPIKALIEGVTFGDRSEFDPDLLTLLQDTGTLHLFVIDGLKVTLLAGISWVAARFFCLPRRWIAGFVIPLLVLYCAATGLSAAGLRATLMALFILAGVSLERPVVQLNAMSASGFILLLYNPEELFQLGFQLSFSIVAFIVMAARPLTSWLVRPFSPDPWLPSQLISPARRLQQRLIHRAVELFAVCTICWVASFPFSVFYFHRISFTNVIANFLAVPVGTWILFTALASILVYPIAGWASICLNNSNWLLAHLFLVIVNGTAAFPGQAMNVSGWPWSDEPKLVVLASGRSESFYFRQGTMKGLINPGSSSKYRRITEPFLRSEGVNHLSFLNWTRSDQDHSGSAMDLSKHFNMAIESPATEFHSRMSGSSSLPFGSRDPSSRTTVSRTPTAVEKISLNQRITWKNTESNQQIEPVIECELGSFEILLLNINRQQIERLPSETVDVVVVPSPRQCSYAELLRRFHPQAVLYLQGKPGKAPQETPVKTEPADQSEIPVWFLGEKGAVTLTLSDKSLALSSYLGARLILRSRSR